MFAQNIVGTAQPQEMKVLVKMKLAVANFANLKKGAKLTENAVVHPCWELLKL